MVYYFCRCMSLHVFSCKMFILHNCLAIFGEINCPFGCLLVMFWFWCRCFKCVLLPVKCLRRKVWGNCIDYWSLPSFLLLSNGLFESEEIFSIRYTQIFKTLILHNHVVVWIVYKIWSIAECLKNKICARHLLNSYQMHVKKIMIHQEIRIFLFKSTHI